MSVEWPESIEFENFNIIIPDTRSVASSRRGVSQTEDTAFIIHVATFTVPRRLTQAQAATVWGTLVNAHRSSLIVQLPAVINASVFPGVLSMNSNWSSDMGFSASVKGFDTAVELALGTFISIRTGGLWYLYTVGATAAAGSATRTVTMAGLPRVTHLADDQVRVNQARIQGYVTFSPRLTDYNLHDGFEFEVREI